MQDSTSRMLVDIASPPDREKLVAELFYDREQWAEINQDSGTLRLELYPRRDGKPWDLPFDEALAVLQTAKERLVG